jgi:hypothetical protein
MCDSIHTAHAHHDSSLKSTEGRSLRHAIIVGEEDMTDLRYEQLSLRDLLEAPDQVLRASDAGSECCCDCNRPLPNPQGG